MISRINQEPQRDIAHVLRPKEPVIRMPRWVADAHVRYMPKRGEPNLTTNIVRSAMSKREIARFLLESGKSRIDLTIVGAGGADSQYATQRCSYVPYALVAMLDDMRVDWNMRIVDLDASVLDDLEQRTHIFMPARDASRVQHEGTFSGKEWNHYLRHTNQQPQIVREAHPQVTINPMAAHLHSKHGVFIAEVPRSFRDALDTGRVQLVRGDIALTDLDINTADFIDVRYVLYQLSPPGQQLAMWNMARSLRKGGRMLLTDFSRRGRFPDSCVRLMNHNGGWMDHTHLADMGLSFPNKINTQSEAGNYTIDKIH